MGETDKRYGCITAEIAGRFPKAARFPIGRTAVEIVAEPPWRKDYYSPVMVIAPSPAR
jgi:hypothetical protein